MGKYSHTPVMLDECIAALNIRPDGIYIDGTAGLGGHSAAIAAALDSGKLYCFDKDAQALALCRERLAPFGDKARFIHGDFRHMKGILGQIGVTEADGVLLDLGVSSLQLDKPERGFSFRFDAELDMRMNAQEGITAKDLVNTLPREELKRIFYEYGEEKFAPKIATAIVNRRPVDTTARLAEIILSVIPSSSRGDDARHPARRCFQALRMAVNDEIGAIREGVGGAISLLRPQGRIAVLTFHSVEDREVKNIFAQAASGCECPPSFPVCVCGKKPRITRQTRKIPTERETEENPRSASAKLRWAEKL
ncbi:MAG: 16S rRNA (cytosine(1402)-N(4))-methyltransferase RsmH [Oscillospiraceae bacterium]|jgi:16S rRNA (cytosine1402-N4)-methyltransferase|nr:16S rRNA (cytosine(1402)-N(4))-methyltransferase RsmH [Oscillospiraceae bacterium]